MRRLATSLIALVACSAAEAAPMTFQEAAQGGNCDSCEWIAADGEITTDTPNQFRKYFQSHPSAYLFINSTGGDVVGGVELGRLLRQNRMMVEVHRTVKSGSYLNDVVKGQCASACSFAFLGGETRSAESGEIGIHQFTQTVKDASVKPVTSVGDERKQLVATVQTIASYLIKYVVDMDVDPRFLALATSTANVFYLDKPQLDSFRVRWQPKEFVPWSIHATGAGIIASSQTRDGILTATVLCRADKIPRLQLTPMADAKTLNEALADAFSITAFGMPVAKSAIAYPTVNGKPVMEVRLDKLNVASLRPDVRVFEADVPHVNRNYFEYKLSDEGLVANVGAALRNCT
jgi:hypothetical protein